MTNPSSTKTQPWSASAASIRASVPKKSGPFSFGGSLLAVDAGIVPVGRQVGVSGKFVSPDIYLAVGISSTPQHLAGISPDTRIVAINKDPAADIFKVASVGVVGDWEQVLPERLFFAVRIFWVPSLPCSD